MVRLLKDWDSWGTWISGSWEQGDRKGIAKSGEEAGEETGQREAFMFQGLRLRVYGSRF